MGRPLRILHVINSLHPSEGGTVECVRQVAGQVTRNGHAVEAVAIADKPDAEWLTRFPIKAHGLGPAFGRYAFSTKLRGWLRRHGRTFDAWIINGLWQYQGFGASRIADELGVPYLIYAHGMLDPWNRRAAPLKYAKKFVYWLAAEKRTLERAKAVIFTSDEEALLANKYFPSCRWRGVVVGNGVAEPPQISKEAISAFRNKWRISDGQKILLFLSRVHPKKGVDILIEAFGALGAADFTLIVAGGGDSSYVGALKELAKRHKIDQRVIWTGPLYDAEKWEAFCAADLFVLPSHQENFGIAVAEALACSTPVCTTTGVNIHSYVTKYGAGLVCQDRTADVAAALRRWSSMSEEQKSEHRLNARRCFEREFRISTAVDKLLSVITQARAKRAQEILA
jgi:glycosyltransferase involved in cell wall biosynthesis